MKDPAVTFYMQEYSVPDRTLDIIPGSWRNDTDFPAPGTKDITFYLAENGKLISQPRDASGKSPRAGIFVWRGGP
jgi:hypothetical protein